jgi:hypothetical protein
MPGDQDGVINIHAAPQRLALQSAVAPAAGRGNGGVASAAAAGVTAGTAGVNIVVHGDQRGVINIHVSGPLHGDGGIESAAAVGVNIVVHGEQCGVINIYAGGAPYPVELSDRDVDAADARKTSVSRKRARNRSSGDQHTGLSSDDCRRKPRRR